MTIYTVTKKWSTDKGGFSTPDGRTYSAKYSEEWQVTHSADATVIEILNAPGLPGIGSIYPGTLNVWCKDVQIGTKGLVMSTVVTSYDGQIGPNGDQTSDPTSTPPVIQWSAAISQAEIDEDGDGEPIVTKAKEKIKGVQKTIHDFVLSVQRNYAFLSIPATHQYLDSVNSDTFAGFDPGVGALTAFSANQVFGDTTYWAVSATITFRLPYNTTSEKAWYFRTLHEGHYCLDSPGGKKIRATVNGEPTATPVRLKEDGTLASNSDPSHYLEIKTKQYSLPYNALGLI